MIKSFLLAAAVLTAHAPASAAPPATPPKLIIAISVDQFAADLFDRYRAEFSGGFDRLAREGTVFRNGYQSHAATETCPGHSTILTGDHPSETGIVANDWVDQRAARTDKHVYCAEDETQPGTNFSSYKVSPAHLRVQTLGDRLKAVSPQSRNVAIAGKDRAAIEMGGRNVDQRWYWDGKSWTTDTGKAPPLSIVRLNQLFAASLAKASEPLVPPATCTARAKAYQLSPTLTVGNGTLQRAAGDTRFARAHPDFDGAVLAGAAALVNELGLGKGAAPDVLSISLSATDYVGHSYGNGGQEMCLQVLALDRELGDFLTEIDKTGIDYALVLTADHGAMDIPERLRDQGVTDAARLDPAVTVDTIGKALAGRIGRTKPVLLGGSLGDVWIDSSLSPRDRRIVEEGALAIARAHPQVYGAWTKAEIAAEKLPTGDPRRWTVQQRLRASFDLARSGDILVALKPHISPVASPTSGYVSSHGSPWDYDRRVPIVFWRRGAAPAERTEAVETVDILPTLAPMIGLKLTAPAIDGRCLDGAAGVRCR